MIVKRQQFWESERNLFFLLIILSIHLFVVIPFGESSMFGRTVIFIFYVFLLGAGLRYLTRNKKFGLIFLITSICVVLLSTKMLSDQRWIALLSNLFIMLYCGLLAWIVLRKTFSQGPITIYRIEGSIVVYLLFGLIFGNLYHLIFRLEGDAAFNGLRAPDIKEFLYFSFTTLTTVGYGDISPAIPASRSIANIEALIGQLYPAILIARLVSMEFSDRGKDRES
jgi:hypothetical protein